MFQVHSSIAPGHQQHLHTVPSFDWTRTWFVVYLPGRRISFVNSIHGTVALFDSMHKQRLDHCPLSDHCVFTICLFTSPDLDGHRAPKMKYCPRRDPQKVPKPEYEATALCSHQSTGYPNPTKSGFTICFTISGVRRHCSFHDRAPDTQKKDGPLVHRLLPFENLRHTLSCCFCSRFGLRVASGARTSLDHRCLE